MLIRQNRGNFFANRKCTFFLSGTCPCFIYIIRVVASPVCSTTSYFHMSRWVLVLLWTLKISDLVCLGLFWLWSYRSPKTATSINSTHSSCNDPAGDDPAVVLTLWVGLTSILVTPSPIFNEVFYLFTESGNKILNCLSAMDAREEENATTFAFTTNLSNLRSK